MTDIDEFQAELCEVVSTFVTGVLEGAEQLPKDEVGEIDIVAAVVAALFDSAILIMLRRGATPEIIAESVRNHATRTIAAQRAKAAAVAN